MARMMERFFRKSGGKASVPNGKKVYAIGDVHGRADMLDDLLWRIKDDAGSLHNSKLIFLGDYVDRGPDSRGVIDRLISLGKDHPDAVFLKGNHEALMLEFLADPEDLPHWLEWGGEETLESYGVDPTGKDPRTLAEELSAAMPKSHHDFLAGLALTHQEGDYVFVHAGLRPGAPLDEQKEEDLLWIRKRFHNAAPDARPEQVVVHGHTPTDKPDDAGWRIGVDTGAVYGGMLTAVVLEGNARRFLSVKDR
jgi:serine/threonine protein phosphatase 1